MDNASKQFEKILPNDAALMVATIFRCKWSLTVYALLATGVHRPGEMVRSVDGLTKKVLHDCLNKNVEFEILERRSFSDVPPRVEYHMTEFGKKFLRVLNEIQRLQDEISHESDQALGAS